jgi:hypothetical protein
MSAKWSLLVLLVIGSVLIQCACAISEEASAQRVGGKIEKKEKGILRGHAQRRQEQPQNGTTTTTTVSPTRPWLDPATVSRFDHPECVEVRTWQQIAQSILSESMPKNDFATGGLGGLQTPEFGVWACFLAHPCVQHMGGQSTDSMCYAFSEDQQSWYPWGFKSDLKMCSH